MAASPKSLKSQNAWIVNSAVLVHVIAFVAVVSDPLQLFSESEARWFDQLKAALAPGTIALALVTLLGLILRGLLPSVWRDRLIHWRWSDPLPGSRAFTRIGPADTRIDMAQLEAKYGPLPEDPSKQNRLFFGIYRDHTDELEVLDPHKSYLATRDVAVITFLFAVLAPIGAFIAKYNLWNALSYFIVLFCAYIFLCLAAQGYGRRLVENTLALASAT